MSFPFVRYPIDRVVIEDSNGIDSVNRGNCHRKLGILSPDRTAASRLDTALKALYRRVEMSPDSQLEQIPQDSQLERLPQGPPHLHVVAHKCSTPLHSTSPHSTDISGNVGGTDAATEPFPDTFGKPEKTLLYGYYLPAKDQWHGNRGHALTSRLIWKRSHAGRVPQPLEGVAVWTLPGGQTVVRTVIRDFFTGAYHVFDRYPKVGPLSG